MDLRSFHKTKSSTFAELSADRGHPGPKFFPCKRLCKSNTNLLEIHKLYTKNIVYYCITNTYINQNKFKRKHRLTDKR